MSITQFHGSRLRDNSVELSKLSAAVKSTLDSVQNKANTADLLGGDNKLLASLLPDSILGGVKFQTLWDASTNTPEIPAAAHENNGHYYKVSVSGSTNIDGESDWSVGDWIVSDGTRWGKVDNSEKTEEALTTHFDKTVKGLLHSDNVQEALDELAVNSSVDFGKNALGGGLAVDFVIPSSSYLGDFVVGYAQGGLFGPISAGKTILSLGDGFVYTVQESGSPVATGGGKGLAVYKVKNASLFGSNKLPCGNYLVHVNAAGVVNKTRIAFDDMIFDSLTQKTVKDKIAEMDTNTALAARMLNRAVPVGSVDGSNVAFTLFATKLLTDTDQVFLDGQLMEPGADADYVLTVSGADTVLTFNGAPPSGSRIRISGIKA